MIFGTLRRHFILNTSDELDSKFIKYIVQSGIICLKLTTRISLSRNAKGVHYKMFRIIISVSLSTEVSANVIELLRGPPVGPHM